MSTASFSCLQRCIFKRFHTFDWYEWWVKCEALIYAVFISDVKTHRFPQCMWNIRWTVEKYKCIYIYRKKKLFPAWAVCTVISIRFSQWFCSSHKRNLPTLILKLISTKYSHDGTAAMTWPAGWHRRGESNFTLVPQSCLLFKKYSSCYYYCSIHLKKAHIVDCATDRAS